MSTKISARAASARESARKADGKFGSYEYERADAVDLAGSAGSAVDLYGTDDWIGLGEDTPAVDPIALERARERMAVAEAERDFQVETARRAAGSARAREMADEVEVWSAILEDEGLGEIPERRGEDDADDSRPDAEEAARAEARARRLASLPSISDLRERENAYDQDVFTPAFIARMRRVAAVEASSVPMAPAMDADDLVSEAAVEIHQRIARGDRGFVEAGTGHVASSFARTIMHAKAVRSTGEKASRNITGRSEYARRRAEEEARLGHSLTRVQEDNLAHEVRMSMPVSNRPSEGFHRLAPALSIDASEGDSLTMSTPDPFDRSLTTESERRIEQTVDRIEQALENGELSARTMRERPWFGVSRVVSLSEPWREEIPEPQPKSLSGSRSTRLIAVVAKAGGADTVARTYLDGNLPERETEALFAAFPDADQHQRELVANFLVDSADRYGSQMAQTLFTSSVAMARTDASDAHEKLRSVLAEV
ncbi:hypothetical protein Bequi_13435 [Brachybacterium sp. JHP9]|uniref:Uncharacterized protein n=1 Tax=Brachybacterium equifaecis TaxID=2910770 RepID=A0ABT0R370_9MICO|nr:hypothetical protein [Brachybacterium equifaecis]MCL6424367.1 hypothetical protein [Brachybacterium equifaecis]